MFNENINVYLIQIDFLRLFKLCKNLGIVNRNRKTPIQYKYNVYNEYKQIIVCHRLFKKFLEKVLHSPKYITHKVCRYQIDYRIAFPELYKLNTFYKKECKIPELIELYNFYNTKIKDLYYNDRLCVYEDGSIFIRAGIKQFYNTAIKILTLKSLQDECFPLLHSFFREVEESPKVFFSVPKPLSKEQIKFEKALSKSNFK